MLNASSVFVQCLFQHLAALGAPLAALGEPLAALGEPLADLVETCRTLVETWLALARRDLEDLELARTLGELV